MQLFINQCKSVKKKIKIKNLHTPSQKIKVLSEVVIIAHQSDFSRQKWPLFAVLCAMYRSSLEKNGRDSRARTFSSARFYEKSSNRDFRSISALYPACDEMITVRLIASSKRVDF